MSRFNKLDTLNYINSTKVVPVFYNADLNIAKNVAKSCYEGGLNILEFTNRGDFAWEIFKELELYCREEIPEMILGAGSIIDASMADLYISTGANFIVGPVTNPHVAKSCNRKKIPYIPGCLTPSEISAAEELGCDVVKIFPADSIGGPSFVKSVLAPMPWSSMMPTGGVDISENSLKDWIDSGVFAIGMGSKLFTSEIITNNDWGLLRSRCTELKKNIEKIMKG